MKLFLAIRYGNDEEGPNGKDTLFLVRAFDRDAAAAVVDAYLTSSLPHDVEEPLCNVMVMLGEDLGKRTSPEILWGPWYGLGAGKLGYKTWLREVHTDYRWVDMDRWYGTK